MRPALRLITAVSPELVRMSMAPVAAAAPTTIGGFDPESGEWRLLDSRGISASTCFGSPCDTHLLGDWNCTGIDTPGLFRRSDGFVYLRNSNTQGTADTIFFVGNLGDVAVAGDSVPGHPVFVD
jgi:hypothetical protein